MSQRNQSGHYQHKDRVKTEEEILLDCIAHEREDSRSIQCIVDYLTQRPQNPLTKEEAHLTAHTYIEESKDNNTHWQTWLSPSLLSYVPRTLTIRTPPQPPATPQPQSRLLSLPPELLIQILIYTLARSPPTILVGTESSLQPPIARTSRLLRKETLPLFYGMNAFIFPLTTHPHLQGSLRWLAMLGDKHVGHLQNLIFLGFIKEMLPHGIAMAVGCHYTLVNERVAINLRSLTAKVQADEDAAPDMMGAWEGHMAELREYLQGYEVGEREVRVMVEHFARGMADEECGEALGW
ncbi:hypothetical protein PRZ48_009838 [Zasmidium cellare]|uniref:F-box domain-containing protein n=1 Tax=Zasmidium cellare TaxID=395010 RepID=A0ABR0ECU1_ZASCE|nr:hypothetical protein PRZ48_009838 [Zasmidium cellare]